MRPAAVFSVLFAAVAAVVAGGATRAIDLDVTVALQRVASFPLDVIANADTVLGQSTVTIATAAVVALLLYRRERGWVWIAPLLILLTGALELVFKFAVAYPGPPEEFVRAWGSPLWVRVPTPSSFPSGHVARVTFLAFFLWWLLPNRPARAALVVLVVLTVWARVYIGDHWISDAVGGLALGLAVGALAVVWLRQARRRAYSRDDAARHRG